MSTPQPSMVYDAYTGRFITNPNPTVIPPAVVFQPVAVIGPLSPAGIVANAFAMMGMGLTGSVFTPKISGRLRVVITSIMANNTAGGQVNVRMRFGTGAAPASGAAETGTQAGSQFNYISTAAVQPAPFTIYAIITGLTLNTQYWFDIAITNNSNPAGSTVQIGAGGCFVQIEEF